MLLSLARICQALGAIAEESGRSRRARPAAGLSVTPRSRGRGVGDSPAAGWDPGLVSCLEGKGPRRGDQGQQQPGTPLTFSLSLSPPFCWKSEVIVSPGWGVLDGGRHWKG